MRNITWQDCLNIAKPEKMYRNPQKDKLRPTSHQPSSIPGCPQSTGSYVTILTITFQGLKRYRRWLQLVLQLQ